MCYGSVSLIWLTDCKSNIRLIAHDGRSVSPEGLTKSDVISAPIAISGLSCRAATLLAPVSRLARRARCRNSKETLNNTFGPRPRASYVGLRAYAGSEKLPPLGRGPHSLGSRSTAYSMSGGAGLNLGPGRGSKLARSVRSGLIRRIISSTSHPIWRRVAYAGACCSAVTAGPSLRCI